jgi:hypothetical protein
MCQQMTLAPRFSCGSFSAPNMHTRTLGVTMRPYHTLAFCVLVTSTSALGLVACGGQGSDAASQKDDAGGPDAAPDVGSAGDATSAGTMQDGEASAAADSASPEAESVSDAGAGDSGASDAASLACGDASCDSDQICLYPACGCAASSAPCAPPSCVSPPAGSGSYDCSPGGVETPACSTVNVPIPSTCGRVCHDICS